MSKRTRHKKKSGRTAPRKPRQTSRRPSRTDEPDLLHKVALALDDEQPLALLALVSGLLAALDPRGRSPFEPDAGLPSRDELVQTFLQVDITETSALLAAIAALSGDEMLRRRVRREIDSRAHALPRWLADLPQAVPSGRAVEVVHVLRDGDNVMIGARLPGGHEITATVYIDHNMGTLAKDAFVVPGSVDELVERMQAITADPDTEVRDLDPADARVRITDAIERGAISFPPFETDTWPACRPVIEWITAMLPAGGTGYQRPEWDDTELADLTGRFLASPEGSGLDDPDHRGLLETLLWFGTDYGPGDPLRWSPTAVEILLADWIPRKIVADVEYLAKAPDLLRAFVRFCHRERTLRAELTAQTLAAVDEFEPDYQQAIRTPRPQGPAALLAAMGALDPDGPWPMADPAGDEPYSYQDIMLDSLRRAVGGEHALDGLDAVPLPDEPFEWEAIPPDVHDRVREVLALVDGCCDELLGPECRTACRRFLSRAAAGDPEIFRRRGKASTAAAAVCWVIAKANSVFGPGGHRRMPVKDLTGHFGTEQSSASQRSEPMLRAIGVSPQQYGAMNLGSPGYLTSTRRAKIIELRDHYRSIGAGGGAP